MALTKETVQAHLKRVVFDLIGIVLIGVIVLLALWAYHGQMAYNYIAAVEAAQAQQRAAQQRPQTPPPATK